MVVGVFFNIVIFFLFYSYWCFFHGIFLWTIAFENTKSKLTDLPGFKKRALKTLAAQPEEAFR